MSLGEAVRPTVASMRVSWRTDGAVLMASLLLVVVVVAGVVASQRSVEAAEEQSLLAALADARADQTRLRVVVTDQFSADTGTNPLAGPQAAAEDAAAIDPLVLSIYGAPRFVVDSPRFIALDIDGVAPASPTGIVFRAHDDLDGRMTRTTGRAPRPTDERIDDRAVFEVEIASRTAETMGWTVGTVALVDSDASDPLFRVFTGVPDPFWVRVTGIVELDPTDDTYWSNDVRLHRPVVADTPVGADFTVYASIPPDQLPELLSILGGRSGSESNSAATSIRRWSTSRIPTRSSGRSPRSSRRHRQRVASAGLLSRSGSARYFVPSPPAATSREPPCWSPMSERWRSPS